MLINSHQVSMSRILMMVLVVFGWTSPARAAEKSVEDPREAARLHYARGLELAGQADYDAALREFTEAYEGSPHFAVLYNIGQAQFALGRPLEAIESLSKYLRDGQEQVPPARRQNVQAQIALLESLFAELTINADRPGVLIALDGREVGRTPLYQGIRLATGTHRIAATMEGTVSIDRTVTLAPGDRQVLTLELRDLQAATAKVKETEPPPPGAGSQPSTTKLETLPMLKLNQRSEPVTPRRRSPMSTVGIATASVGAALGGAALGVYLWKRGRYQDWQDNNAALQQNTGAIDYHARQIANNQLADSLTRANHVIASLSIAGGVLLAGGVAVWVRDRFRRATEADASPGKTASGISMGWGGPGRSSASISWSAPW